MPGKVVELSDDLSVTIYKRKGSRNLRLSIGPNGKVRVTIPSWAPYKAGVEFARSRQAWIEEQAIVPSLLVDGQSIGKAHHLYFISVPTGRAVSSRLSTNRIVVRYPVGTAVDDPEVQNVAQEVCIKALRAQGEQLLPQRLATLANKHGFTYGSISIKRMKGRWGSCDQHKNIVLNLFLMQLPWELIDYVLLHELTHTNVLRHGPDFWDAMETVLPNAKAYRKKVHAHQPVLS